MKEETQKKKVGIIQIREIWDAFDEFTDDDAIRYWLFDEENYNIHTDYNPPHNAETCDEALIEIAKNNPKYHIFPLKVYEHGGRVYIAINETAEEWESEQHKYGMCEDFSGCVAVLKGGISRYDAYLFANEQTKILNKICKGMVYDIVIDGEEIENWLDTYEVTDWFKRNLGKYDYDKIDVDGSEATLDEFCNKTYTPSLEKILGE